MQGMNVEHWSEVICVGAILLSVAGPTWIISYLFPASHIASATVPFACLAGIGAVALLVGLVGMFINIFRIAFTD